MPQIYIGASIFDGVTLHASSALVVDGGHVTDILPATETGRVKGARIELDGGTLAPGMIDLQVNGGGGIMLGNIDGPKGIATICAAHRQLGATGILPTLISDTPENTHRVVTAAIQAVQMRTPGFLGLHLEGPHLDPGRHGAHDCNLIRTMENTDLALILEAARVLPVLMVTLAPESVTLEQISTMAKAGVIVSLGHSNAKCASAKAAMAAGARSVTHLFNAMSQLANREPGIVGAALDSDCYAGIIADGFHVADASLRIALRAKAADRVFLVSDAMAVAGTEQSRFFLGDREHAREIVRESGRLKLRDGTLAGADVTLPQSVAHLCRIGIEPARALAMASSVPAALVCLADKRGYLFPGSPAEFVHLDNEFNLLRVWHPSDLT
jgi:N-acetylglucosamine-6-phosphate deacetylase